MQVLRMWLLNLSGNGTIDEITENGPESGKPFWTIGFEAFNDEARVKQILEEVLPLELANENCPTENFPRRHATRHMMFTKLNSFQ